MNDKGYTVHCIAIQETWLCENNVLLPHLEIHGYNFVYSPCRISRHSGVAFYLLSQFSYEIVPNNTEFETFECITLKVSSSKDKFIISNIYRPPRDNLNVFNTELEMLLELTKHQDNIALVGDFNINLLSINSSHASQAFLDLTLSYGLCPMITLPSRVAPTAANLIDNIFIKCKNIVQSHKSFILVETLSDHYAVFSSLQCKIDDQRKVSGIKHTVFRKQGEKEFSLFKSKLDNINFNRIIDFSPNADPNINYSKLNTTLTDLSNSCFPLKRQRINRRRHKLNPWMTDSLLRCVNKKVYLYKQMKNTPITDPSHAQKANTFKAYDSMLKRIIRARKKEYHCLYFEKNSNDIRKTWFGIKKLITNNVDNSTQIEFVNGNETISDSHLVAAHFNDYFSSIGEVFASRIQEVPTASFNDYLTRNIISEFHFKPLSNEEVSKIIDGLNSKNSSGHDGVSVRLLKYVKHTLLDTLTCIINQSIFHGTFPDELKIAKVTPIYKNGKKENIGNYRPISVLPSVSKVFEKALANQLTDYLEENKYLPSNQYAYRSLHSTEHASLEFVDKLLKMLDDDQVPLSVFIDLSKAFDTLDHTILLEKLKYYGVMNKSLQLLSSYLENRKQYVYWNNSASEYKDITIGVPQGSILGPLLFILYMSDFQFSSNIFEFVCYADDTTLYTNRNTDELVLNSEINKVANWLKLNKLSINPKKTKLMTFSYRRNIPDPSIYLDNEKIASVDEFNFLGLTLDKHLSWKPHINKIVNKLSRTNFILSKLKNFLPINILRLMYFSLFQCHLNFGILNWGHTITSSDILTKLQKRSIRIITNSPYRCHTTPLFKALDILKLSDLFYLFQLKFLYNFSNKLLPTYFLHHMHLEYVREIHPYNTRYNTARIPIAKKIKSEKCIRFYLCVVTNNSPRIILDKTKTHSLDGFSSYVKKYVIHNYSVSCELDNCYICHNVA